MAGPKPAALPLGDVPTSHLTIIEYKELMSRSFACLKPANNSRLFIVNKVWRFYAVALFVLKIP